MFVCLGMRAGVLCMSPRRLVKHRLELGVQDKAGLHKEQKVQSISPVVFFSSSSSFAASFASTSPSFLFV